MYLPVNAEMMYSAEVVADSLNIRSIPNNEGRIIGSLFRGQKILVSPTSNEWVKTRLNENQKLIISVKTERGATYRTFVDVLDELKMAGATKISIANPEE